MKTMYKTIIPYGYVNEKLVVRTYQYKDKYYLKDISGNQYRIDEETFKEIANDWNKILL